MVEFIVSELLGFIPDDLKSRARDAVVDVVTNQAEEHVGRDAARKLRGLRSDAAFLKAFDEGLQRALQRFVVEYEEQDEDLVAAIAADPTIFQNKEVEAALLTMLRRPGTYLGDEREHLVQTFASVLPGRKKRERVDRAVTYLLRCLAEELWHLPELQPIYSLHFQKGSYEAQRQQVELQRAQLAALSDLNAGLRDALLHLTDTIAQQKLLPTASTLAIPPPPRVYHNLPQPDYGQFIGREEELAQVMRILRPYPYSQSHLVTIDGIGGIGKSALALEAAYHYLLNYEDLPPEERFDVIIWTSAKNTALFGEGIVSRRQTIRNLDDIYSAVATTLGRNDITRAREGERDEVVRHTLAQQRTLLIVDNLETVDDDNVLTFLRELPAPTKAIVTTRHRIDVAFPIRLMGMPWHDAQMLISLECDRKRVALSAEDIRRLYDRTGGVPLAIVWSVAQMGFGYGVEAVLTRLGLPTSDVARYCFVSALETMRKQKAENILFALSLFSSDGSREALGSISDLSELDRDDGLVVLEKLSLVNRISERFSLLPLTKSFASSFLGQDPMAQSSLRLGFIEYFLGLVKELGGERTEFGTERVLAYAELDRDIENVQQAIDWAYQLQLWSQVGEFVDALVIYLDHRELLRELISYSDMAVEAGRKTNNLALIMRHKQFGLGWAKIVHFHQVDEGVQALEEAKAIAVKLNDKRVYALAQRSLGIAYRYSKGYERSKELILESLEILRELDDPRQVTIAIGNLGGLEAETKRFEPAAEYYREAIDLGEKTRNLDLVALNQRRLSFALRSSGKGAEARLAAFEALNRYRELNLPLDVAKAFVEVARVEYSLGNIAAAQEAALQAYELFSRLQSQRHLNKTAAFLDELGTLSQRTVGERDDWTLDK